MIGQLISASLDENQFKFFLLKNYFSAEDSDMYSATCAGVGTNIGMYKRRFNVLYSTSK